MDKRVCEDSTEQGDAVRYSEGRKEEKMKMSRKKFLFLIKDLKELNLLKSVKDI